MREYQTDEEYVAAKREISNALVALDRMDLEVAVEYLNQRASRLNDEQVKLVYGVSDEPLDNQAARLIEGVES